MNNEGTRKPAATEPDPRVQLAFERTFLAYERTRIAWVRTALALISFGFAIAKVLQYLREQRGETATLMSPRAVGLIMIGIGLVSLILADRQDRRAVKALRQRCPELPTPNDGIDRVAWRSGPDCRRSAIRIGSKADSGPKLVGGIASALHRRSRRTAW